MDQSYTCNVSISYIKNSNLILLILIFKVIKMCGGYLSGEIFIFLFFFSFVDGKADGKRNEISAFLSYFFSCFCNAIFLGNFCSESGIT